MYPQFNEFVLPIGYALMPNIGGNLDFETVNEINENDISDVKEQLRIMHENGQALSIMNYSIIENLSELFYYEFMQMMKNGRQIKLCKNCGKYFVLKDKRRREYCERIFKDGKTCHQVGAISQYQESLADKYLKKAQGLYNTMYSRMSRALDKFPGQKSDKDLTEDEFYAWSKIYSRAKKDYISGKISGDEMIERIKQKI